MDSGNESLRKELDAAALLRLPDEYRVRIEELTSKFGHAIKILDVTFPGGVQPTCFAYALGLGHNPEYQKLLANSSVEGLPPLDSALLKKMIDGGELRESRSPERDGVVVYFENDAPKHAGTVISADTIRSKWGPAEVHEHGLWEVPHSYGNKVNFYSAPSADEVLNTIRTKA